jgi:hypothetical protein
VAFLLAVAWATSLEHLHHGFTDCNAEELVRIQSSRYPASCLLTVRSTDLWALAAVQLNDEDRRNIDFSRRDKLQTLADLHALAERSKQECIKNRWKYTRKSGETVILRDVFNKIIRWIDIFKQAGDLAVQYDPVHAALPWAGVRFVLQVRVAQRH